MKDWNLRNNLILPLRKCIQISQEKDGGTDKNVHWIRTAYSLFAISVAIGIRCLSARHHSSTFAPCGTMSMNVLYRVLGGNESERRLTAAQCLEHPWMTHLNNQ